MGPVSHIPQDMLVFLILHLRSVRNDCIHQHQICIRKMSALKFRAPPHLRRLVRWGKGSRALICIAFVNACQSQAVAAGVMPKKHSLLEFLQLSLEALNYRLSYGNLYFALHKFSALYMSMAAGQVCLSQFCRTRRLRRIATRSSLRDRIGFMSVKKKKDSKLHGKIDSKRRIYRAQPTAQLSNISNIYFNSGWGECLYIIYNVRLGVSEYMHRRIIN